MLGKLNLEAENKAMEKLNSKLELPLMEAFYTIQGEGFHSGTPAYFIRLAGCDVGCHWCDVKESWDAEKHRLENITSIVSQAEKFPSRFVVITGGEPLMYNLDELCRQLKKKNFYLAMETSGAHSFSGIFDWICLSPKKAKPPKQEIYSHANELKIIIYNKDDFKWAEEHAAMVSSDCKLYLQPEWGKSEKMLPLIIEYAKNNPSWNISLQTHKFLNIP